jgi:lipoprotein-releasing system permease protein
MPFELFVAIRYLVAPRKQAFISVISAISTLGVAVGVTALIVALALMTGLQQELRDRILGSTAHLYVWKAGEGGIADYQAEARKLGALEGVVGAAPVILGKALASTGQGRAFITVKGIDPALERRVTNLERAMREGSLAALAAPSEGAPPPILIGQDLAMTLGVSVGDEIALLTPEGTLSPMGLIPRLGRLKVAGIFSLGLYEFDASYGFVHLETARRLFHRDGVDFIELRVADIYRAPALAEAIPARLGSQYVAQDWADMNRSLFSALWLEKMAISITIGLIVVVAALNIVASLVLLVMEKHRDIAILKTMGASSRSITVIFMLQGLIIGLVGTSAGAVAGTVAAVVLDRYRLIRLPMDVYQVAYVPFTILPGDFALVVLAAILVCFVATIYPSRQAARLDPAQALRYG